MWIGRKLELEREAQRKEDKGSTAIAFSAKRDKAK